MNKEKRRVPKLRFPGFTEDWEQRKLGDLMEVTSVKRIHQADWTDSGVRFFRARDIVSSMNNEEVDNPVFISEDKYEEYSRISGKVIEGDLLVTGVGTIGVPYLIKDSTPLYFKDGNIIWFKNNNILNGEYFYYCFQNNSIQSQIYSASGKGTVGTYTIENGKKTSISYPSLKEQVKIGKLLDTMTIMITLHQRKLEHLNLKKKALLQKLFPKNGERYPELRFPGFTDAWEQRKLGDFTNQINTFVNPEDAKLPLWSLTAEAGLIEKSDRYERDFLVKKKDQFKRIETNTLVYNPMNITIGSIDIYTGLYPIAVSGYYVSIVYDKNIDTDFLKEVLLLPSSLKMYKNYATGSLIERQRVQYPTFSKLQLLLPNLDEQKAIGQIFKSLNLNITLHQRKLEHLQLQKKSLLQQMFV